MQHSASTTATSNEHSILVINPGSTSTKVAVYVGENPLCVSTIRHSDEELSQFQCIEDQRDFRRQLVLDWLKDNHIPFVFDAIIGRGGLIKPIASGVYRVNEKCVTKPILPCVSMLAT